MNTSYNKKLLDERKFTIKKRSKPPKKLSSFYNKVFYEAMDFLTLYEAGYNQLGLNYMIHLDIPKFLLDEYTQQVWDIIQEFEELVEIFGVNTKFESGEIPSDSELIVSIYQLK